MNNYDSIKSMSLEDMAHFLCGEMDYLGDDKNNSCGICPVRDKCEADRMNGNGWFHWLREEAEC